VRAARTGDTVPVPAARTSRGFVVTAAVIYAAVFAAFLLLERPGLGIGHFYYLAIALIALGLGPRWGAAAGGFATLLYAAGVLVNHTVPSSEIFTLSTPIRLVNYVAMGALLGWFAEHYRAANAELQILAQRDLVTGLPNTRAFELAIDRRLEAAQPFALLVGDLDARSFDEDRDEALRRVSESLIQALGADADVARVGAEEFAVLVPCDSVESAAQLAAGLERNLCESGSLVTFGWSACPREGENALTLYRAADERLYARRVLRQPRASGIHALA
jgi:diguanylate cyclase (GGDEF)-like protein